MTSLSWSRVGSPKFVEIGTLMSASLPNIPESGRVTHGRYQSNCRNERCFCARVLMRMHCRCRAGDCEPTHVSKGEGGRQMRSNQRRRRWMQWRRHAAPATDADEPAEMLRPNRVMLAIVVPTASLRPSVSMGGGVHPQASRPSPSASKCLQRARLPQLRNKCIGSLDTGRYKARIRAVTIRKFRWTSLASRKRFDGSKTGGF